MNSIIPMYEIKWLGCSWNANIDVFGCATRVKRNICWKYIFF